MVDQIIAENLNTVRGQIAKASSRAGCRLVAVSKVQPIESVIAALDAGHRIFGENRVQEATTKWPDLKSRYPDIELHLIGSLQTNKVKSALALFDVIQSLDRPKLARAISRAVKADGTGLVAPRLFIQVNTGEEPQKGGVLPGELPALITLCRDELGLKIEGLMCIPPTGEEPALHFALLAKLAQRHGCAGLSMGLSMGMSSDFELAAEMGASHVRVGTAIFGERQTAL